jgi:hypothetical protein
MIAVRQLAGVAAFPFGGYAQAERTRIVLGQEDIIEALKADPQQVSCKAQVKGQCVHFCNCCSKIAQTYAHVLRLFFAYCYQDLHGCVLKD